MTLPNGSNHHIGLRVDFVFLFGDASVDIHVKNEKKTEDSPFLWKAIAPTNNPTMMSKW